MKKKLSSLLWGLVLFCSGLSAQTLSGTYTVGGTSPDYSTVDSAIIALTANGVSGPVKFKIRQGTYSGFLTIGAVTGASATNTVEFVADQANTAAVVISHGSTGSTNNYTMRFNAASYVTLDSLTINATNTTYGRVISMQGLNSNITISNCILNGISTTSSTSNALAVIYDATGSSNKASDIKILNNTINDGTYGIYLYGVGSTNFEQNSEIKDNIITGFRYYGIYSYYQANNEISGNYIKDNNSYTSPYGMRVYYNDFVNVFNNKVEVGGTSSPYGMYIYYCDGSASTPVKVYNNTIVQYNTAASSSPTGLYGNQGSFNEFYYNSASVHGSGTSGRALYISYSSGDDAKIMNNIFANEGNGYAIYVSTNSGLDTSDYNTLSFKGNNIGYWSGAKATLAAFRTSSGQEANSTDANPYFKSMFDLTPKNGAQDSSAVPLAGYTVDMNGATRNASNPDMGAIEFAAPGLDAGVSNLKETSFCSGSQPIVAVISSYGNTTLTSATVNWTVSVNGGTASTLTPATWNGSVTIGDTAHVSLGNYTFASGSTYDFTFYTTAPNAGTDIDVSNDTFKLNGISTALSGTYSLGGSSPDFASFAALKTALSTNGMCGPVRVEVRQGTYNEQIEIDAINGLSATNTLEIVADQANTAAAILTYGSTASASNYTIQFNGANNVTIDSLEIVATGTSYGRAISFSGLNSEIEISNNTIKGVTTTSTSTNLSVIYDFSGTANKNEDIIIDNNDIMGGSYGIYMYGVSSSNFEIGGEIINNDITGFLRYGVYSYYQANNVIAGNYVEDNNSYSSPYGLRVYYNDTCEVYDNEVYIGGTSSPYGIYFYYCDGSSTKPALLYNNMVSMYSSAATSTVYGIYLNQGSNNNVRHNTVSVYGGSTSARALYFSYGSGDNANIENNNLNNFGGGYAIYRSTSTGLNSSDYNNLYATGSNVGYWGSAQSSLTDYQNASSGDANSVSGDPSFTSSMDLRSKGAVINNEGTPITNITTDIFGTTRSSTTPDIGAYEFTPPANDVAAIAILSPMDGACGETAMDVIVVLKNVGTSTQSNVPVSVEISGSLTQTLTGTGGASISSGSNDTITLGPINTKAGGTYNFEFYTTLSTDTDNSDDTVSVNGVVINGLPATPAVPTSATVCAGADTFLVATGSTDIYRWYLKSNPDSTIHTGDTLQLKNLQSTTQFEVAGLNLTPTTFGPTTAPTSGYLATNAGRGTGFDVLAPEVTIDSVNIYTQGNGWLIIHVSNYSGVVSQSSDTIFITSPSTGFTKMRVPVKLTVPYGVGKYKLTITYSGISSLGRNSQSYPFTSPGGEIKIVGGATGTGNPTSSNNYWFYDWSVIVPGCASERATSTLNVTPLPVFDLGPDTAFCGASSISYTLDATTTNGSYKWNDASTNATLTATAAGTYWCEVTVNSCSSTDTARVGANALPTVNFPNPSNVCANSAPLALSGATPTGGVYSGTNVFGGDFDASAAGAGVDTLYYTFTDTIGCMATDTAFITVDSVPTVTLGQFSDVCENGGRVALISGLPTGGTYLGTGVSGISFEPSVAGSGTHTISYAFIDANNCTDTASQSIVVDTVPVVSVSMPANWCLNASPISLNSGMPMGGTYTVNGTVDTVYMSMSAGMDTVVYTFVDSNNCMSDDTALVQADTVPVVSFAAITDLCVGSSATMLTQGAPAGGVYAGNNVSGGSYNPVAVATDTLMYTFTDANNCSDAATQTVTVNALPNVSLTSQNSVCENTPSFALSGGSPGGGSYSGNGVNAGQFDASAAGLGATLVTYSFTDANNCSSEDTASVQVNAVTAANLSFLGFICDNGDVKDLTFLGTPQGGTFSGTGVSGTDFDPTVAGSGTHAITYAFTNADNCMDSTNQNITVEASPAFNITGDTIGCGTGSSAPVLKSSVTGMTYRWSNGSSADSTVVTTSGQVWLKLTDPSTNSLCFSYDTVMVTYEEVCVGISEALAGTSVSYFPNPNNGNFSYAIEGFEGLDIELNIVNGAGQVVYSETLNNVSNTVNGQIALEDVETGIYFVKLVTNKGYVMHRVAITH